MLEYFFFLFVLFQLIFVPISAYCKLFWNWLFFLPCNFVRKQSSRDVLNKVVAKDLAKFKWKHLYWGKTLVPESLNNKERNSGRVALLWILWNFEEQLLCWASVSDCFFLWILEVNWIFTRCPHKVLDLRPMWTSYVSSFDVID